MASRRRSSAGAEHASKTPWAGLPLGSRVLVDTAPFIYILESHPVLANRFAGLFEAAAKGELTIALSTITIAEVLTGPANAGLTALAKRYERALCQYEVVPITAAVAALAAQLRAQHRLRLPDALQLACALETGAAALVTHDRDFNRVTALPILGGG
ncbi:MAG: type II toxin-antitoxin system VapC family toxin [Betaproteobacteria bacterium]